MQPYIIKVYEADGYGNNNIFLGARYLNGDKYDMITMWTARLVQIFRSKAYKKNNQNIIIKKINYKIFMTYRNDRLINTKRILFFN